MHYNEFGRKEDDPTEALLKSGLQTFNTGMKSNDPELLEIARRQLELASKGGSVMGEFFKQILLIRLSDESSEVDFSKIAPPLFEMLNDPYLEYLFIGILKSFQETLEFADKYQTFKLLPVAENFEGTMDEILNLLKKTMTEENTDISTKLNNLYSSIAKFLKSAPHESDQT